MLNAKKAAKKNGGRKKAEKARFFCVVASLGL